MPMCAVRSCCMTEGLWRNVSRLFLRRPSPLLHHWLLGQWCRLRAAGGGVAVNLKATNVLAAGVAGAARSAQQAHSNVF